MSITVTLYRLETTDNFGDIERRLTEIDDSETTDQGTVLTTYTSSLNPLQRDVLLGRLTYHTEGYFPISEEEGQYYADEHSSFFTLFGNRYLLIFRKKLEANNFATVMNSQMYGEEDILRDFQFIEETMLRFMRENPHQTSNAYIGGLDTPGAYGNSIYGGDVENSEPYRESLDRGGHHSWVRMKIIRSGHNVGISKKKGQITFFTKIDPMGVIEFLQTHILPLI